MSQETVAPKQPKTVSIWLYLFIVLAYAALLSVSGWFIGEKFVWTNPEMMRAQQELAHYQNLLKNNPDDLDSKVALGYRYYILEDYDNAVKTLKEVIEVDKNYYDAYLNLGYVYFAMEKYDVALENFEKCSKIVPSDYKGWLNMGIASYKLKNYDKALEYIGNAKTINRGSADVLYHYGVAVELKGDIEGAIGLYEEALAFDPNYEEAKGALKRLKRG